MARTKKRDNKRTSRILLIASLMLIVFSLSLLYFRPLETKTLDVKFSVGEDIGISLDTDKLDFGRVVRSGSAERKIVLENNYNFPVEVKTFVSREISPFISAEQDLIIPPGNEIKVPIYLKVPEDALLREYSGKIRFEFRKTKYN